MIAVTGKSIGRYTLFHSWILGTYSSYSSLTQICCTIYHPHDNFQPFNGPITSYVTNKMPFQSNWRFHLIIHPMDSPYGYHGIDITMT